MKKAYYFELNQDKDNWGITLDEQLAQSKDFYRLANMDDLFDWVCATGETFAGEYLEIEEGQVRWSDEQCEYIMCYDRKALEFDVVFAEKQEEYVHELAAAYEEDGFYID